MIVRHHPGDPKFSLDPDAWAEVIQLDPPEDALEDAGWAPTGELGIAPVGGAMCPPSQEFIYVRSADRAAGATGDSGLLIKAEDVAQSVYAECRWQVLKRVEED